MSIDFQAVRDAVNLEELVSRYTSLSRSKNGPCPQCGGSDRFYIHSGGKRCGCRNCDLRGDAVDFMSRVENISKQKAASRLLSEVGMHTVPDPGFSDKRRTWRDESWQIEAKLSIEAGQSGLTSGFAKFPATRPDDSIGRDYVQSRGLALATCAAFQIGYTPAHFDPKENGKRPAMVIPGIDSKGVVSGIKYRFCDSLAESDTTRRFTQKAGSESILFGIQNATGGGTSRTLVALEGEWNALSVWQATREQGFDVLSVGAEKGLTPMRALKTFAAHMQYERVLLWFDKPECASAAQAAIPKAIPMKSPQGLDANAILQKHGHSGLTKLIESVLGRSEGEPTADIASPESSKQPLPFEGEYTDSALWRNVDALHVHAKRCIEHPDADQHPVIVEAAKELLRMTKAFDAKCFEGPEAAQEWLSNHGPRARSLVGNIDAASRVSRMLEGKELEAAGREIIKGMIAE